MHIDSIFISISRDGVSEGQLPQVMFYEINAIKNAIKRFNKDNIEVTCMVVQKRHHVRLFPANQHETDDRNGNVRAGTIVDTTITHPDHIDFYLVSHASIQVKLLVSFFNMFICIIINGSLFINKYQRNFTMNSN